MLLLIYGKNYLREVRGAREAMPEPSVCAQPDMLRLDSAVSSDRGARSALRRIPWQCCSFSAVSPVRLPSGCRLYIHMIHVTGPDLSAIRF